MASLTCPVCAAPVRQGDLICINCGANLARREAPQQQYPPQQDQQHGYQDQSQYAQQQGYPGQDQPYQQYPPQQQGYPQQEDSQRQQSGYPPPQGYPPAPDPGYPPPHDQRTGGYPPPQDQGYPPPQQDRQQGYAPPQDHGYVDQGYPPQPDQGYPPPQQQPYQPQQQGYGGGYGSPPTPHMPPPREPAMPGGESTAAFTPFCPHCGAEIPDIGNPVCVQCLRPLNDHGGGAGGPQQVSVVVTFSSSDLQVHPGQELVLGRDPVHSPVAGTFSHFDNVSRRHATIGIDNNGQPWVRDERSTNGTFVNDRRLQPGEQTSLRDGDSLRLAADARGQVRIGR
jgi:hypothetical protein